MFWLKNVLQGYSKESLHLLKVFCRKTIVEYSNPIAFLELFDQQILHKQLIV